jgi:hypothetical protein
MAEANEAADLSFHWFSSLAANLRKKSAANNSEYAKRNARSLQLWFMGRSSRRGILCLRACRAGCDEAMQIASSFHSAHPYPHVEIPDFFSPAFASELAQNFPLPQKSKAGWFLYNNPIEIKFANNDRASLPASINAAIDLLNSDKTRRLVSAISGVPFLEEVCLNISQWSLSCNMRIRMSICTGAASIVIPPAASSTCTWYAPTALRAKLL